MSRFLPRRLASAFWNYWVPVAHAQAQEFFQEQMDAHEGAWHTTMVVAIVVFLLHGAVDAIIGFLPAALFLAEALWRSGVGVVLVALTLAFSRAKRLVDKQRLAAGYVFCLMVGLVGTVVLVPPRAPYVLFPITFATLISISLWLQGRQMAWAMGLAAVPAAWVLHGSGLAGKAAATYLFYVALSVVLGLVFRRGRLMAAFDAFLLRRRLLDQAHSDPLTGVLNRAGWDHRLAKTPGTTASLLYFDLDRFKAVNDTYGHPVGDALLQDTAKVVRPLLREHDVLARFGGEEFVVFLPGVGQREAAKVAERIRRAMHERTDHPPATLSIGVAQMGMEETVAQALERADQALFRAKQGGRDRVELAD